MASHRRSDVGADQRRPGRYRLRVIPSSRDGQGAHVYDACGNDHRPRPQVLAKGGCSTSAAPSPPAGDTKVDRSFLERTFNDVQRFWRHEFDAAGLTYTAARLVIFSSRVNSGCGVQENSGPFYCPANHGIYLDVGFFDLLARHAGLGGFAQAYIIGHEFGHHLQQLLGIHRRVAEANQGSPAGKNARSVLVELQADCLAGVWAHSAYTRDELTASDIEEKLKTAALVGDDFQARANNKPADPGLFTHGSSAQRQQWLKTGFESGDPGACDTFAGG
jgi:predicted metalloprotease